MRPFPIPPTMEKLAAAAAWTPPDVSTLSPEVQARMAAQYLIAAYGPDKDSNRAQAFKNMLSTGQGRANLWKGWYNTKADPLGTKGMWLKAASARPKDAPDFTEALKDYEGQYPGMTNWVHGTMGAESSHGKNKMAKGNLFQIQPIAMRELNRRGMWDKAVNWKREAKAAPAKPAEVPAAAPVAAEAAKAPAVTREMLMAWNTIMNNANLTPEGKLKALAAAGYTPAHLESLEGAVAKDPYALTRPVERAKISAAAKGAESMRNRMLAGGGVGAALGGGAGYMLGGDEGSAGLGATLGGATGATGTALMHAPQRSSMAQKVMGAIRSLPKIGSEVPAFHMNKIAYMEGYMGGLVRNQLPRNEGFRPDWYTDPTPKLKQKVAGYGQTADTLGQWAAKVPLTKETALQAAKDYYDKTIIPGLTKEFPDFKDWSMPEQNLLTAAYYNVGPGWNKSFPEAYKKLKAGDRPGAVQEFMHKDTALDIPSKWSGSKWGQAALKPFMVKPEAQVAQESKPLDKGGEEKPTLYHYVLGPKGGKTPSQIAEEIRSSGVIKPGDEVPGTEEAYKNRPPGRGREPGMVYLTPHDLNVPGAERFEIPVDSLPGEAMVQLKARKYPMTRLPAMLAEFGPGQAQRVFDKARERRFKTLLQVVHKGSVPLGKTSEETDFPVSEAPNPQSYDKPGQGERSQQARKEPYRDAELNNLMFALGGPPTVAERPFKTPLQGNAVGTAPPPEEVPAALPAPAADMPKEGALAGCLREGLEKAALLANVGEMAVDDNGGRNPRIVKIVTKEQLSRVVREIIGRGLVPPGFSSGFKDRLGGPPMVAELPQLPAVAHRDVGTVPPLGGEGEAIKMAGEGPLGRCLREGLEKAATAR